MVAFTKIRSTRKAKRSKITGIIEEINKAVEISDASVAIRAACNEFSHRSEEIHDLEVDMGAATVLYKQIVLLVHHEKHHAKDQTHELTELICHALSLVYRCSLYKRAHSVYDIGENLITLMLQAVIGTELGEKSKTVEHVAYTIRLLSEVDSLHMLIMSHRDFKNFFLHVLNKVPKKEAQVEVMRAIASLTLNAENLKRLQNDQVLREALITPTGEGDGNDELKKWADVTLFNLTGAPNSEMPLVTKPPVSDKEFEESNHAVLVETDNIKKFKEPMATVLRDSENLIEEPNLGLETDSDKDLRKSTKQKLIKFKKNTMHKKFKEPMATVLRDSENLIEELDVGSETFSNKDLRKSSKQKLIKSKKNTMHMEQGRPHGSETDSDKNFRKSTKQKVIKFKKNTMHMEQGRPQEQSTQETASQETNVLTTSPEDCSTTDDEFPEILEAINGIIDYMDKATTFEEKTMALQAACKAFSHTNEKIHDIVVDNGAAAVLCWQLVQALQEETDRMQTLVDGICHAFSLIYRCSLTKRASSVFENGEILIDSLLQVLYISAESKTIEYSLRTIRLLSQSSSLRPIIIDHKDFMKIYAHILNNFDVRSAQIEALYTLANLTCTTDNMEKLQGNYELFEAIVLAYSKISERNEIKKWAEVTILNNMPVPITPQLLNTLTELAKLKSCEFGIDFLPTILQQQTGEGLNQELIISFNDGELVEILLDMMTSDVIDFDAKVSAMSSLANLIKSETIKVLLQNHPRVSLTFATIYHNDVEMDKCIFCALKAIMDCGIFVQAPNYSQVLLCINTLLKSNNESHRFAALTCLKRHSEITKNSCEISKYPEQLDVLSTFLRNGIQDKQNTCIKKEENNLIDANMSCGGETSAVLDIFLNIVSVGENREHVANVPSFLNALYYVLSSNADETCRDLIHYDSGLKIVMQLASNIKSLKYLLNHEGLMSWFVENSVKADFASSAENNQDCHLSEDTKMELKNTLHEGLVELKTAKNVRFDLASNTQDDYNVHSFDVMKNELNNFVNDEQSDGILSEGSEVKFGIMRTILLSLCYSHCYM